MEFRTAEFSQLTEILGGNSWGNPLKVLQEKGVNSGWEFLEDDGGRQGDR